MRFNLVVLLDFYIRFSIVKNNIVHDIIFKKIIILNN